VMSDCLDSSDVKFTDDDLVGSIKLVAREIYRLRDHLLTMPVVRYFPLLGPTLLLINIIIEKLNPA